MTRLRRTRLVTRDLGVEVRWACHNGRWIASAARQTAQRSARVGRRKTLTAALEPFDGVIIEALLDTVSDEPPL